MFQQVASSHVFLFTQNQTLKHVEQLVEFKDGIETLNQNCSGINLNYKRFKNSNLSGSDFTGSTMHEVNISGSNLKNTKLVCADLRRSNLSNVDLEGANLRGARISAANLSGVDLSRVNLEQVEIVSTQCDSKTILPESHACDKYNYIKPKKEKKINKIEEPYRESDFCSKVKKSIKLVKTCSTKFYH